MNKEKTIDTLFENSNHGTRREDIEAAYNAGAQAEREFCSKNRKDILALLAVCLSEAEGWLDEARGCTPQDVIGYDGWADKARAILLSNASTEH